MKNGDRKDVLESPYRGIHPFRYVDQAYFFGREKPVNELFAKALLSRLVLFFGESATGKSSLINAGLIPAFEKEGLNPERLRFRPISHEPILIERIQTGKDDHSPFLPSIFVDDKPKTNTGRRFVSCSLERFLKTIHDEASEAHSVLIFDQFEELFTLFGQNKNQAAEEKALQGHLLDAIFQIVNNKIFKTKMMIIIREDFLGKLEILAKNYPQVFDYRVRLESLDKISAIKAVLGPFEKKHPFPSQLKPDLAEIIVQDLSSSQPNIQIHPTQLQIICSRLWEEYALNKSEITAEDFKNLGGVNGILEGFLKSELEQVEPALKSQAVMILGNLITEVDTRDVVSKDQLMHQIAPSKTIGEEEISSALKFLEERRLVNRTYQRGTDFYEIASEYLIQPIKKESEKLAIQQELADAKHREEEQKQRADKNRLWAVALGVMFLIAVVAALYAFVKEKQAKNMEKFANTKAKEARKAQEKDSISAAKADNLRRVVFSWKLAADANHNLNKDPELSVLLAREAISVTDSAKIPAISEAELALNQALQAVRIRRTLRGHSKWVRSVAFSPDGARLATASFDRTVKVWDTNSGKLLNNRIDQSTDIYGMAFSSDGMRLTTIDNNGNMKVCEVVTGNVLQTIDLQTGAIDFVTFSQDGKRLATASFDGTVKVLDAVSGKTLDTFNVHTTVLQSVALSPDGKRLATANSAGRVKMWDVVSRKALDTLNVHTTAVINGLAFSVDGKRLATGSSDGTARVWDLASGQELLTLYGHTAAVYGVAFSPNGTLLATASRDRTAKIWDMYSNQELRHTAGVNKVAYNREGTRLVTACDDGKAKVWDASSGQELFTLSDHAEKLYDVAFSPDGSMIATASKDDTVRIWNAINGNEIARIRHELYALAVAFSPNRKRLITASADRTAKIFDVETGRELLAPFVHNEWVYDVAFSPDGTHIATASGKAVKIWNAENFKELYTLSDHKATVYAIAFAFSPDRRRLRLATASYDTVKVYDVETQKKLYTLSGHTAAIRDVTFSPDGKRLATASEDKTVKVWDIETRKELYTLSGHNAAVYSVAFSPDGKRVATASADRSVRIFALNIDDLKNLAQRRIKRPLTSEERKKYLSPK